MKEPLCKKGTATIRINSEPPKPTTFEDLGYVQVIRCKDCRYYIEPDSHGDRCDKIHWSRGDDWFCADGKCKEER